MTDSKYPSLHVETKTADTKNYLYAIHSLKTDSPELMDTIQTWIDETKKRFIEAAIKDVSHNRVATLYIDLETTPISDTIYNVIFSKYKIIGGANGTSEFKPLMINIEECKIYTLSDFIENTDEIKKYSHNSFSKNRGV